MSIYDYKIKNANNEDISLNNYEGKVLLIVNTATGCGFTPQYEDLEKLWEQYHDKGLEIIDIPCNQFAGQTPGTQEEISNFCALHYNTQFPQMLKSEVNGANELPLYTFLKSQKTFEGFGKGPKALAMKALLKGIDPDYANNSDIKWNFTKFLIDKNGNVVERFEPTQSIDLIEKEILELL